MSFMLKLLLEVYFLNTRTSHWILLEFGIREHRAKPKNIFKNAVFYIKSAENCFILLFNMGANPPPGTPTTAPQNQIAPKSSDCTAGFILFKLL